MTISGAACVAGVAGWPVTQSLSPRLHAFWLEEHGIDGAYVPIAVAPDRFATVAIGLRLAGFRGVNVTVPHKEAAHAIAGRLDPAARAIGAVNLLLFDAEGFEGRNTDAYGLTASLDEALGEGCIAGRPVAIWGAGGTARAAAFALAKMGASEVRILNRTPTRAEALAAVLAPSLPCRVLGMGYDRWQTASVDSVLLVHTTSAGMHDVPSLDLALDCMPANAAVLDVVYNPLRTTLLERAAARGLQTIDGLGMLLHQAVPSFAAFYGATPKVTPALRKVLEKALTRG